MNPKPSLPQCLVLHEIDDDSVWFDLITGKWHTSYNRGDCTVQVDILHRDGYVYISPDVIPVISLTDAGREVLARRPYAELVERLNGG